MALGSALPVGSDLNEFAVSVVVPCCNEQESLPELVDCLAPMLNKSYGENAWEMILVNDGSTDQTEHVIEDVNRSYPNIWGINLTRNFGHQAALFTGLRYSSGSITAFMDADLQDPPEVLQQLIALVKSGEYDVAYGIRAKRDASQLLNTCYRTFYRLMSRISEHPWQVDAGDFCAMSRKAVRLILSIGEKDKFLRGLRSWIGLRQIGIPYCRPRRHSGRSKYNYSRLYRLAMKGMVGFSTAPLRLASFLSLLLGAACIVTAVLFSINRLFPSASLFGYNIGENQGIATIAILLLLVASAILAALGIIGEYLAVVLIEVKQRPISLVSSTIGR